MKIRGHVRRITQITLLTGFVCMTSFALAAEGQQTKRGLPFGKTGDLEGRSQPASPRRTLANDYIRKRLDWLKVSDPRHFKVFAYFDTLIDMGYGPMLLDTWLDRLNDGVVIVGMPGQLVLDYYGTPVFRNDIIYDGLPAQVWSVRIAPGRLAEITVAGGNVVRVRE